MIPIQAYSSPVIEFVFLSSVVVLWSMIFYQLFFAFAGFIYHRRMLRKAKIMAGIPGNADLPGVSILIPAHNEALVIEKTLEAMCALDYPGDRLEIIVINDGSMDETGTLVDACAKTDPRVRLFDVPVEKAARGKSHALNLGLEVTRHDLVAIYDADNRPDPGALKFLVRTLSEQPKTAAAFGLFRTLNRHKNLLTRFINLETLSFQYMIQAGRCLVSKIGILPGTNFVIRKDILTELGGWDEQALTEDTELSIRIYEHGKEIIFVPFAVTWEQEPETWGVWLRQRTRWVRGNFYVLKKFMIPSLRFRKRSLAMELIYLFLLYYLFLGSILASHFIFILSAAGIISVLSPGPYFAVWFCAFALFCAEMMVCASYEGEAGVKNFFIIALMYFTYCQGWIVLVFRALFQEFRSGGKFQWEKTRRFAVDAGKKL
ncbi:MAG: glycosyltransferase family 2 protein [Deltaproteobacteria bacterium]|nr:glycosyltransferase family 2 protein [Deltaproteobacteria bacterium]